jgi:gas vesicle protein
MTMTARQCLRRIASRRFLMIALIMGVAHGAIADDTSVQAEAKRAGQSVDSAARQVGEEAKQAGKEVADTAKKVAKDVADASKQAGKEVANTANKAGSEVKNAAKSGVAAVKQDGQTIKPQAAKQNEPIGATEPKKPDGP